MVQGFLGVVQFVFIVHCDASVGSINTLQTASVSETALAPTPELGFRGWRRASTVR